MIYVNPRDINRIPLFMPIYGISFPRHSTSAKPNMIPPQYGYIIDINKDTPIRIKRFKTFDYDPNTNQRQNIRVYHDLIFEHVFADTYEEANTVWQAIQNNTFRIGLPDINDF